MVKKMTDVAKQCPWCQRWCLKDAACNYVFACGYTDTNVFVVGAGCGQSWCWECGLKYCGPYFSSITGQRLSSARDSHSTCCALEKGFDQKTYCPGGHSSHCAKRW